LTGNKPNALGWNIIIIELRALYTSSFDMCLKPKESKHSSPPAIKVENDFVSHLWYTFDRTESAILVKEKLANLQ
jgi:hypothetical protein